MSETPFLYIPELAKALNRGIASTWVLLNKESEKLPVRKIGGRSVVLRRDFERFIETLPVDGRSKRVAGDGIGQSPAMQAIRSAR